MDNADLRPIDAVAAAGLERVSPFGPGIRRIPRTDGFEYSDEHGDRITDPDALERIKHLAIPPAWRDVWISPNPLRHIQATGFDRAGRMSTRASSAAIARAG